MITVSVGHSTGSCDALSIVLCLHGIMIIDL